MAFSKIFQFENWLRNLPLFIIWWIFYNVGIFVLKTFSSAFPSVEKDFSIANRHLNETQCFLYSFYKAYMGLISSQYVFRKCHYFYLNMLQHVLLTLRDISVVENIPALRLRITQKDIMFYW